MGGDYYHISIERKTEERDGEVHKTVEVIAKTHGCSCCSHEEHPHWRALEAHIETLKKDIKIARKAIKILKAEEAKRDAELDKVHADWVRTEFDKIDAEEQANEDEARGLK